MKGGRGEAQCGKTRGGPQHRPHSFSHPARGGQEVCAKGMRIKCKYK